MQQVAAPIVKDLVLIGGGHSHVIALRIFGMKPLPGVRLILITEASDTPYSGMLPGHVAGFYNHQQCHIDLRRLAQFAQAQLYVDRVVGLDLANKKVICAQHPPVGFDLLSINIGSTPAKISVPGAVEYAIPAKPVANLLTQWNQLVESVTRNPHPFRLGIVGGGAGGVELALAMQSHLQQILAKDLEIHLFQRDPELMPDYNPWVRRHLAAILRHRGIQLHLQETVNQVQPGKLSCESGLQVECDRIFWVTQASAPAWLKAAGLSTDSSGFVQVNENLQSVSHPDVFAAGDIASMVSYPRSKAGVFAVRQGKPLFENLQRMLLAKPLKPYKPQKQYLSLIGTGDQRAIAAWGKFGFGPTRLLWRLKDRIDRQFMQRFSSLPEMSAGGSKDKTTSPLTIQHQIQNQMRCAGCGSKVGSTVLSQVLHRIKQEQPRLDESQDIVIGLATPDDAAVVKVPLGLLMVHTIDYFRALINDPYIFGQISANHCLSDIFAMGATPQSALAIATIPYALEAKVAETLYQLLSGATKVLNQAHAPLVGGHTTEGAELSFGLSCNGLVHPDKLLRKGGLQPGQVLILTKALGIGTLFAADMRREAKGRWVDNAVTSMLQSNQAAAACLWQHRATACTDITGFGLVGHLVEMLQAANVAVELKLAAIPVLEGAPETIAKGIVSSLQSDNFRASRYIANLEQFQLSPNYPLLFDPQTAGGLLAAVPAEQASVCLATLKALGYNQSNIIGCVDYPVAASPPIILI